MDSLAFQHSQVTPKALAFKIPLERTIAASRKDAPTGAPFLVGQLSKRRFAMLIETLTFPALLLLARSPELSTYCLLP